MNLSEAREEIKKARDEMLKKNPEISELYEEEFNKTFNNAVKRAKELVK